MGNCRLNLGKMKTIRKHSRNHFENVSKYVDEKGSAAMMASKRSAGVSPEENLRILLYEGNEASKQEIHPGFETQDRHYQKSKTGVSVAPQKF